MGCMQATSARVKVGQGGFGNRYEVDELDAFGDDLPQARNLPRLLDSAAFQRAPDDQLDNISTGSSRPTTISAIQTPSVVLSNLESLALSSTRAELDKDSFYDPRSVGVPSIAGTNCGKESLISMEDMESNFGDASESRVDTQAYLQELELAAGIGYFSPAHVSEAGNFHM
mmetsp:Transcript_12613/g.35927  ORF Transcript_12613/g.35927 Transcript_12613/m.35927 type:complete len:171 (-) Transcript_12613:112-624(-)